MKKVLFYLPAALAIGVLAYFLYGFWGRLLDSWEILLAQAGVVLVFVLSAVLLDRGHWLGCIPEIALGCWFIWLGVNNQSPIIDEKLVGIALAAYYAVCGVVSWHSRRR
ncbi:MAG: hypothetical protein Q4F17_09420 [Eubacteriales bacterium]|nr:hypothetical protein [Eubacteriales bacterium]